MRLILAVMCVVALSSSVPGEEARDGLRFAWPERARATVDLLTEQCVGDATRTIKLRQRLDVQPAEGGGNLLVRMSDPAIVEINGAPPSRAWADPEAIDVSRVMAQVLPSFTVSATGAYVRHEEVARVVGAVMRAAGLPEIPLGRKAFESLVTDVARSDWQSWVGLWIGERQRPGEWTRTDRVVDFQGTPTAARLTRRALEPPGGGRNARLQAEVEYPSAAVRSYTAGFLVDLAIDAKELGTEVDDVLRNKRWLDQAAFSPITETVTVELESATMRPLVVERTRTFFAEHGRHRVEGRERRVHRFTWQD